MKNQTIKISAIPESTVDDDGFVTPGTALEKTIYAEVKSVGFGEYYEGLRAGVMASMIFKVNPVDFYLSKTVGNVTTTYKPTQIIYNGTTYNIVRKYRRGNGFLELTCEEIE
jgi:co-chaperonin GroES (HSP10)